MGLSWVTTNTKQYTLVCVAGDGEIDIYSLPLGSDVGQFITELQEREFEERDEPIGDLIAYTRELNGGLKTFLYKMDAYDHCNGEPIASCIHNHKWGGNQ